MTVLIDADKLLELLGVHAKRTHTIAGRWTGVGAGRSSGVYLAMSEVQRLKEETERATRNE